jgi:hypothetical protein
MLMITECLQKLLKMFSVSLNSKMSPVTPRIPGVLKNSRRVLYCCSCLNQMPELFLHVGSFQVPQVEVSGCEIRRLQRPQNWSGFSCLSVWIVRVQ